MVGIWALSYLRSVTTRACGVLPIKMWSYVTYLFRSLAGYVRSTQALKSWWTNTGRSISVGTFEEILTTLPLSKSKRLSVFIRVFGEKTEVVGLLPGTIHLPLCKLNSSSSTPPSRALTRSMAAVQVCAGFAVHASTLRPLPALAKAPRVPEDFRMLGQSPLVSHISLHAEEGVPSARAKFASRRAP